MQGGQTESFRKYGNYILLKKLAAGGMAEVFLARPAVSAGNGRVQVIKRILPHIANEPEFLKMFRAEVQVILGFNHPHTVQLHDFGEVDLQPFIAMEYIEGKSLKEIVNKFKSMNQTMPLPMAIGLIAQASAGLSYAHGFVNKVTGEAVNAIHRDVSPQNLIVSYDGNLKVIDFGIAKAQSGASDSTRSGIIKGKVNYLSPEQVKGVELDPRTDIFALGVVAWEMVTFDRPFGRGSETQSTILEKIKHCEQFLVPPSSLIPSCPPEVDQLIMKALENDPDKRYANAADFQKAAREVLRNLFPHYSYTDTADIMKSLFKEEIETERLEIRHLNEEAQRTLIPSEATVTLSGTTEYAPPASAAFAGSGTSGFTPPPPFPYPYPPQAAGGTQTTAKTGTSRRNIVIFGLYILGILFIKVDQYYSILDRIFLTDDRDIIETQTVTVRHRARRPYSSAVRKPAARIVRNR